MLLPLRQFVQLLSRLTHRRDGRGWRERSHNINFLSNRRHHSSWRITSKKQGRYWNCRSSSRHISLCWPILLPASESRRAASDRLSGIFKFGQILQLVKRWGMNRFVIHGWHSPLRRRWARGRRKRDGSQTQEELEGFGGNASGVIPPEEPGKSFPAFLPSYNTSPTEVKSKKHIQHAEGTMCTFPSSTSGKLYTWVYRNRRQNNYIANNPNGAGLETT